MTIAEQFSPDREQSRSRASTDLQSRIGPAVNVAAKFADAVDQEGRFPEEALSELKAQKLLGILLPTISGGEGCDVADAAQICYALGRACSSTSMIYAMHTANVACLVNHAGENTFVRDALRRIASEQMLVASSTTEGQNGGNVRNSTAPIMRDGDRISLDRDASVVSYGLAADAILTIARRTQDSLPNDQALVLFFREDYELRHTGGWDAMGMRGTCSEGYRLVARGRIDQLLAEPYDRIHRRSMVPVTHLLWGACWAGIAAGAVSRAQGFLRRAARTQRGALPPGSSLATQATLSLMTLLGLVESTTRDYLERRGDPARLDDPGFQSSMTLFKVSASELATKTVLDAFFASGIAGYRNNGEFSISRQLRDILSSMVMINNQRILTNAGPSCLIGGVPEYLMGDR